MAALVKRPELIDDRELKSAKDDAFRHSDVAAQVADLAWKVEMPANIALYGAWGSGKTSLGNLIAASFPESTQRQARFVRFDAFKYKEKPLRRHFIAQVARSLGVEDEAFREDLYRDKKTFRLNVPPMEAARVIGFFVLAILALSAVTMIFIALAAAVAEGDFNDNLSDFAKSGLALGFAPAGLIAAFLALAGKGFPVERAQPRADSEEEFEALFLRLREKAKTDRLIVFIDELDRCPPDELVGTLETIRTFLDVKGCVFIVAADQQVLERALRLKLEQATPIDTANPYYSAGSGYLDKTFQYQLQLPPLRTPRLTQYALDLVENREGVWERIDRAETIPVLVPTHVRSPRRVKVLLNSFALLYRLAERRKEANALEGDIAPRAPELAKLTCLRVEFPLFAADLALDARIPEYVLALHGGDDIPEFVRPEVAVRARLYAEGRLPVDEPLVEQPEVGRNGIGDMPTSGGRPDGGPEDDDEQDEKANEDEQPTVLADVAQRVRSAQAEQLFAYLRKTEYVDGPGRDLVHLESTGALHGIDEGLAEGLQDAAVNGDRRTITSTVSALKDPAAQLSALEYLADVTRDATHYGIEGRNSASSLLAAVAALPNLDITGAVAKIAGAVAAQMAREEIAPADLRGALALGLRARGPFGDRLLRDVMFSGEALEEDIGHAIASAAGQLEGVDRPRLIDVLAARVAAADASSVLAIPGEDAFVSELLNEVADRLSDWLVVPEGERPEGEELHQPQREALDQVLEGSTDEGRVETARASLRLLLALGTSNARASVVSRLPELGPITNHALAREALLAARRRVLQEIPLWLDSLDAKAVAESSEELQSFVDRLWTLSGKPDAEWAEVVAALNAMQRLVSEIAVSVPLARLEAHAATSPTTGEEAALHSAGLRLADEFNTHGLVDWPAFAKVALVNLSAAVGQALPAGPEQSLVDHVAEWIPRLANESDEESRAAAASAIAGSPWLPSPIRETMQMQVAAVQMVAGEITEEPISFKALHELRDAHGAAFGDALACWLRAFPPDPEDAASVLAPFIGAQLPEVLRQGISDYAAGLDSGALYLLFHSSVRRILETVPHSSFLQAGRIADADHEQLAAGLLEEFEKATNNTQREHILQFWEAVPFDEGPQKSLIEAVALPMIEGGVQGLEMVSRHRKALLPLPYGVRGRLRDALKAARKNKPAERHADQLLLDLALQKKGLLGRRSDAD